MRITTAVPSALATLLLSAPVFASFAETFVDPLVADCSGQKLLPWLGGSCNDHDLDGDSRTPAAEDTDGDAVFGTIQGAIDNTDPGGVVHLQVPGVYREALSIMGTITLRGREDVDIIIDGSAGSCVGSPGFPSTGVSVLAPAKVTLQNLTIRGFDVGVQMSSDTGQRVRLINCRIESNTTGVATGSTGSGFLDIIDSKIVLNTTGVQVTGGSTTVTPISMTGTLVANNGSSGVVLGNGQFHAGRSRFNNNGLNGITVASTVNPNSVTVDDSELLNNGVRGLASTSAALIALSNCHIAGNGTDGVLIGNFFSGTSTAAISGCRIEGNGGDGIEANASSATAVLLTLWKNSVTANQGFGINNTGLGSVVLDCNPGDNLFALNQAGRFASGTPCTLGTSAHNQY